MPDDETYKCDVCGEEFESEEAVERHVHEVGIVD
jgi:DNA-directed RNA polymerase subunit RPC12/RpoP